MPRARVVYILHDLDTMTECAAFTVKHEAITTMNRPAHIDNRFQLEAVLDGKVYTPATYGEIRIVATKEKGEPVDVWPKKSS